MSCGCGCADTIYVPKVASIVRTEKMGTKEMLIELKLDDGSELGHQPGQFVEVSLPGIGEAPISVSSSPTKTGSFEIVVRAAGNVTNALHTLEAGSKVGIRGPFGKGFDTEFLKGKDILFIGGGLGIVPMRSLINYVIANKGDYGKTQILYGCKEPAELLFGGEIESDWTACQDLEHKLTVDACPEGQCWEDNIGVVTTLIPGAEFDVNTTYAVVVGPPIFYRFVLQELAKKGVPDDHIILSLERHMKCGVGKCGHCQINGTYVCQEGPVFNYADIKNLPEAF
jgi:NAD(P)H-flavin reductase